MVAERFSVADAFPSVSDGAWRAVAEDDLRAASFNERLVRETPEGVDLQPVYSRRDRPGQPDPEGFPGFPPFVRGASATRIQPAGWELRMEQGDPDLAEARRGICEDVDGGATALLLRLDQAARAGRDADDPHASRWVGCDGLTVYHRADLAALLADIDLTRVRVHLDAGAAFLPAAAILVAHWRERGLDLNQVHGSFQADPLAVWALEGALPFPAPDGLRLLADLARWTDRNLPHVASVAVDTAPYYEAGATAVQELALALSTAVQYLRAMTESGLSVDAACRQVRFQFRVGTDHFLSIAKLRAARRTWWRVVEACGGSPAGGGAMLQVRLGNRVMSRREPHLNIVRNAMAVFAAAAAGAETITPVPFEIGNGPPGSFSRRLARNALLILQEEAQLHRVIDPAGGSWYLDSLTEQLAEKAWSTFQEIEQQGGMLVALQHGWVANQIKPAAKARQRAIAERRQVLIGVNEFPDLEIAAAPSGRSDRVELQDAVCARLSAARNRAYSPGALLPDASRMEYAVVAADAGASLGQIAQALEFFQHAREIPSMAPCRLAEPFEQLRDACDEWAAQQNRRPRVPLVDQKQGRRGRHCREFAASLLQMAGFDVMEVGDPSGLNSVSASFTPGDGGLAVLCVHDGDSVAEIAGQVSALRTAGARWIALAVPAGMDDSQCHSAGADECLFEGCDAVAVLRGLLRAAGVTVP